MNFKFTPRCCSSSGTQSGRVEVEMDKAFVVVGVLVVLDLVGNVSGFSGIGYS